MKKVKDEDYNSEDLDFLFKLSLVMIALLLIFILGILIIPSETIKAIMFSIFIVTIVLINWVIDSE